MFFTKKRAGIRLIYARGGKMNTQISLTVENMNPDSVEKIKNALERINGVERVIVSLDNRKVFIEYDDEKINDQLIKETIEDEGYIVK